MLSRHRLFKRRAAATWLTSGTSLASDIWIWSWEKASPVASQQRQTHWSVNSTCTGWPKKQAHFVLYALTSSNIDRFSNLFDCLNQENICNITVTKDPTTPQVCRYSWISVLKATVENKTTSVTTHFKSASSSSKADTLNILCKNRKMRQLVWIIIEKINTLFPVVTVLKCVVTKVALFSIVVCKTPTFHKVV